MGRRAAGKTSMRAIIFSDYLSKDTERITFTNSVEKSNLKFLNNLSFSLWDCAG